MFWLKRCTSSLVSDVNISQGGIATRFRCGAIVSESDHFVTILTDFQFLPHCYERIAGISALDQALEEVKHTNFSQKYF